MQQFKVGDKVILNPKATFQGPVPSPRIFEIKHLIKGGRYVLDNVFICNSHQILSIPLFKEGDLVQVHPKYGSCKGKQSLDNNIFRVLKVRKSDVYIPGRPGEDGYDYLLDTSIFPTLPAYKWNSSELTKATSEMMEIKVDIDELNNLLDECLNNNNNDESRLQGKETSVSSRISEGPSRVHGRKHCARISISSPQHKKGVRG